jgi:Zn-finger nucleic acid-binding protein
MSTVQDEVIAALEKLQLLDTTENESRMPSGQRPCPICGQKMAVQAMRGINLDVCEAHGIWLDNGELPALIARSGDATQTLAKIRRARRDGQTSGMMFGLWAPLLDP